LRSVSLEDWLLALRQNQKSKDLERNAKEKLSVCMKKKFEEKVVQNFPNRCPYCDQPISYDEFDLRIGENKIRCPSCKRMYIKVVLDDEGEG
jgi:DNA-directed RNA polymerase subunit RPC12/RpoP